MKRQIRNNGTESIKLVGTTFKKLYLQVVTVVPSVDGISPKDIDLTKLRIALTLNQHGKQISSSFNGVGPTLLGALKNADVDGFGVIGMDASGTACGGTLVSDDSTTMNGLLTIPILYNGLSLTDDDCLEIDIELLNGLFGLGNATDDSKVYLVTEEGLDVEQLDLQLPVYYPVTADKQSPAFNEESVSEIAILSGLQLTNNADWAYHSLEYKSLYANERFDQITLRAKQIIDTPQKEGNSVMIHRNSGSTLDRCEVNLDVDTSKLITGSEFLYVMRAKHNAKLASRALSHRSKVSQRKASMRGLKLGKNW